MRSSAASRLVSSRLLGLAASSLLFALMQSAPAAGQACAQSPMTRLGGAGSFGSSVSPSVSANGRYVAFASSASDLDGDSIDDIFVYDRLTCALELVSVNSTGVKGNFFSEAPSISDDGRFVAFISKASNLVSPDVNELAADAFVRDRQLGVTTLVSVTSSGVQPLTESATSVSISGNGQVVAFVSAATTLVLDDTNNEADVFVRDLAAGLTERVSVATSGQQGDSPVAVGVVDPVLSENGRFVAFMSRMNTLVPGDFNNGNDIFVRDRMLNTTVRASLTSAGAEVSPGSMSPPAITADGRHVFFASNTNFIAGDGTCDGIFIRDLVLNTTSCPVLDPLDVYTGSAARRPAVSADGRFVAFTSSEDHYVPGETDWVQVYVHDRTTGAIHRASASQYGVPANGSASARVDITGDGQLVAFDTAAFNLVALPDGTSTNDVFLATWSALSSAPDSNLTLNGSFQAGLQRWQTFATPDAGYIVTDESGGELQFYRVPPPAGSSNQAVVFQQTWARLLAHAPLEARFRLGNSSDVRKRMSVLVHDADFSDLSVCTFWLEPGAPMRDYAIRTHTTKFWSNATISFYAATAGSDGGFYRVDDVVVIYDPLLDDDVTDCIDPTAPAAPGGAPSPTLLTNGDFSGGLAPWTTFGQITWQITNGVFEFVRPPGTPAGVLLQATGQALAQHDILTALVYLGNSSTVRKRVTLILHDNDFSDLSACTFWLAPSAPLAPFFMRTFTTRPWANATLSVYPATVGPDEWIRFTDAVLQLTPGTTPLGTECLEPGAGAIVSARGFTGAVGTLGGISRTPAARAGAGPGGTAQPTLTALATATGPITVWQGMLDLGPVLHPQFVFESRLVGSASTGLVQISPDGIEWITVAEVPVSDTWSTVLVDLSAHAGQVVPARLALQAVASSAGQPPDEWSIRQIRVSSRRTLK